MHKFAKGMKDHFGITHGVNDYLDPMLTALKSKPALNIFKLDEWLHEKFGNYEDDEKSMEDIIREHFGESAVKFVTNNL